MLWMVYETMSWKITKRGLEIQRIRLVVKMLQCLHQPAEVSSEALLKYVRYASAAEAEGSVFSSAATRLPSQTVPSPPRCRIRFPSTPFFFALGNPGAPSFTSGGPFPDGALSLADWGRDRLSQAHDKYLQKRSSRERGYFWFWCFHNISHDPVAPEKDRLRTPLGFKVPHNKIFLLSGRKYYVYKGASVTYSFVARWIKVQDGMKKGTFPFFPTPYS